MTVNFHRVGAITLFVDDLARSQRWYTTAFERPVVHEDDDSAVLEFDNTMINLLRRTAADDLIAPAPVGTRDDSARFQLTIWVDDVDTASNQLEERGIVLVNGPIDRPWGQRTVCIADPDGHLWEIAQALR